MEELSLSDELDDLIDLATKVASKTEGVTLTDPSQIEVKKFILAKDIQSSDQTSIHAKLVYDVYTQWSEHPLTYKRFVKYFTLFFKKVRSSNNMLFKIGPAPFGLPSTYNFYRDERFVQRPLKKSKYNGVYQIAGYYVARFRTEENTHYIGRYPTEKEAALAHDKYAYLHFGLTTKLNFPENKDVYEKEITEEK